MATRPQLLVDQLERGCIGLWFSPLLEPDFAHYLRVSGQLSRATLVSIIVVALISVALLDASVMGLPPALVSPSRILQFAVMMPPVLIAAAFCLGKPASKAVEPAMVLMFFAMIASLLIQRSVDSAGGYDMPVELNGAAIVAMFGLARIRFWMMLPSAVLAFASVAGSEIWMIAPSANGYYHLFSTGVLVVVGICTGYSTEYFIRRTWLTGALLHHRAHIDGLTGVLNRPALEMAIERARPEVEQDPRGFAVAMVDIDHFGAYNDHYGHPLGDAALRQVAAALNAQLRRPADICGRYGGEEFMLLWLSDSSATLFPWAEATRAAVEDLDIEHACSTAASCVTVSIGVCHIDGIRAKTVAFDKILQAADGLLYQAKDAGRNCVRCGRYGTLRRADGDRRLPHEPAQYQHAKERPDQRAENMRA